MTSTTRITTSITRGTKLLTATSLSLAMATPWEPGAGVDQNVYNAAVKDRDEKAAALTKTQAELAAERAAHKKDADRATVLANKLTALGQDVSRLETERTGLGGELEQANRRMEEMKKAQEQAEARAAQFLSCVTQFKTLTDAGKLKVEIRENRMIIAQATRSLRPGQDGPQAGGQGRASSR